MFFKYFERNYYVQYSRFNVQRAEARHAAEPATADPRQPAKAGRKSQRQAERAAEVSHRAFELERPGSVPGLFCSDSKRRADEPTGPAFDRPPLNLQVAPCDEAIAPDPARDILSRLKLGDHKCCGY